MGAVSGMRSVVALTRLQHIYSEDYLMCLKAVSSLASFLPGDDLTDLLVTRESLNPDSYSFGKPWKYLEF